MNKVCLDLGTVKMQAAVLALAEEEALAGIPRIDNGFDAAPVLGTEVIGGRGGARLDVCPGRATENISGGGRDDRAA